MTQESVAGAHIALAVTLKQFYTQVYPCSRARAHAYVAAGELDTFLDHGRRMVTIAKAREFVDRKAAAGGAIPWEVSEQKAAAGRKGRAAQKAMFKESVAAASANPA